MANIIEERGMENTKDYYAFISYSHKDEEWAKWLQHEFENYHLPTTLNAIPNLPEKFRPIFRDIDELSGGELKPQISAALKSSAYMVIICSPNSAKSPYVDDAMEGHSTSPHTAAFNADGSLVLTVSTTEMKVWDTNSNIQLGHDMKAFDEFFAAMFTKDGKGIITETKKDYDILFNWEPLQELIDRTRQQTKHRQFTEQEKKRFYLE